MSLQGSKREGTSISTIWSIWGGSSEFEWFWERTAEILYGKPSTWGIISEIPSTAEELRREQKRLEDIIAGQDHGSGTLPPIDEEKWGEIIRTPVPGADDKHEDDEVAHTWMHIAREFAQGIINPAPSLPMNLAPGLTLGPTVGPSTPVNQAATAAAMADNCDGMQWSGGVPPKGYKVVNSCGVGVLRKVRRRRRRRILSASDASDIATIVGLVGKGQMASSLINRRS